MKIRCYFGFSIIILLLLVCIIPVTVNAAGYNVSGYVFSDQNRNGVRDTGETGIAGVTVILTSTGTSGVPPLLMKTTTGTGGQYTFSGLGTGTYTALESVPQGYFNSTPAKVTATIKTSSSTVDFGNTAYRAYVYSTSQLYVVDTGSDAIIKTIEGLSNAYQLAETPDHKKAFVVASTQVYVIDLGTNSKSSTLSIGGSSIAIGPDGKKAYVTNNNGYVYVIDTTAYTYSRVYLGPYLKNITITPDGKQAYISGGGYLYILNTAANTFTKKYLGGTLGKIVIAPNGKYAFIANSNGYLFSVNISTGSSKKTWIGTDMSGDLAITPDSKQVYVTNTGKSLYVLNTSTLAMKTITLPYTVSSGANNIVIAQTGNVAYVNVGYKSGRNVYGYIVPVDTSANTLKSKISTGAISTFNAITPNGKKIYSAGIMRTSQPLMMTNVSSGTVTSISAVQSARFIAIG